MPGRRERTRHRCLGWRHPVLELAFLECDLAEACERLEDLFLAGGLEVLRDRPLERRLVLPEEPGHPVELFDAPLRSSASRPSRSGASAASNRSWNGFMVMASSKSVNYFDCRATNPVSPWFRTMRKLAFPAIIFA